MPYQTIVSTAIAAEHLQDPDWVFVDCRFDLAHPARGREDYARAHIPGAVYADLNHDLSAPVQPGVTGRHPLPDVAAFAARLSAWGIGKGVQVVVYDDSAGMVAGRLWWLLRFVGHDAVALLDGDWRAWTREGRPVSADAAVPVPRLFHPHLHPELVADSAEIAAALPSRALALLDARTQERYRGLNETLDPKAGHIPGARSAWFGANVDADGHWRPAGELRARYEALLGDRDPAECIVYCGSGVSACHNLVAMEIAGLPGARLYPGSWSHWITDPGRPLATEEIA